MKHLLLACCLVAMPGLTHAGEAQPMAQDPKVEARLLVISEELRCLVCQNEALSSSHAELAEDLRREVRKLIRENKTDAEIKTYLVERYGDFVLYKPPLKPLTWPLWFGPFILFGLALFGLWRYLRLRKQLPSSRLDAQGRAQAEQLLKD